MAHEEILIRLLRPLGVYDLGARAVNRGELSAYGSGLDLGLEELEHMIREMSLATAEDTGLDMVDSLLPYHPISTTVAERRRALASLLRIGGDSFTLSDINDTLSGCGVYAKAAEGASPGRVEITFPDTPGVPESFEQMKAIIEEILPCHLDVTYQFRYNTWLELMERISAWGAQTAAALSWDELAAWIG